MSKNGGRPTENRAQRVLGIWQNPKRRSGRTVNGCGNHCVLQTEMCLWFLRAGRLAGTTMVGIIVGFITGEPGAAPRRV